MRRRPPARQLRLLDDDRPRVVDDGVAGIVIRESRRAKHLILRMTPPYAVELVVPRGTRPGVVQQFLIEHRGWIDRALEELRRRYPESSRSLPVRVELPAIGAAWEVLCENADGSKSGLREQPGCLRLALPVRDADEGRELMRRWLLRQGRRHLTPWLRREAERVGAAPRRVQIRTQRTRWGSCSAQGTISLNAALLFLDASLARYLLVHELCHLRHLNHSPAYWRLVARFEPDHCELDARLAAAWPQVPVWALPR